MNSQNDSCILLFVKSLAKGRVKTRLAAHIGWDATLKLYECFVFDTLETLKGLDAESVICFDPAGAQEEFKRWLGGRYSYAAQVGRDLGQRMKNAFVHAFEEGFEKAILIGSDLPDLPVDFLREALDALESHDVVIGPSSDGGYYLIGFTPRSFLPEAFDDIPWSSDGVFERMTGVLRRYERDVHIFPLWHDVDTPTDLQSLLSRTRLTPFEKSRTYRYLMTNGLGSKLNVPL